MTENREFKRRVRLRPQGAPGRKLLESVASAPLPWEVTEPRESYDVPAHLPFTDSAEAGLADVVERFPDEQPIGTDRLLIALLHTPEGRDVAASLGIDPEGLTPVSWTPAEWPRLR